MPSKKLTAEKELGKKPDIQEKPTNGSSHKNGNHTNRTSVHTIENKIITTAKATKKAAPKKKGAKKTVTAKKASKPKEINSKTVEFRLRFHTEYGQSLFILGDHELLGNMDVANALPLEYLDNDHWKIDLDISKVKEPVRYQYVLQQKDGSLAYDWGLKVFDPTMFQCNTLLVIDSWNHAGYFENVFYTEPFKDVLLERPSHQDKKATKSFTHHFTVKAPLLQTGEVICLLGKGDWLNSWNTESPLLLNKKAEEDFWSIKLDLANAPHIVYKYGVWDTLNNRFVRYEDGNNRFVQPTVQGQQLSVNDGFVVLPNTIWKGSGIAIPVFSLRTQNSFGVGEFTDLKLLVDWAKQVGLKMIQILPVNDTSAAHTWKDSYPYAAISAFALHPIYLNLEKITDAKNKSLLKKLESKRKELNAEPTLNYQEVIKQKLHYIEQVYPLQKTSTFANKEFKEFFKANEHWLVPYAVFCYLRDEYGTSDFNQWPAYKKYNETELEALANEESASHDKINFHFFIQYHLHLQLKEATEYAHSNKIIVKGDIPIGIYRYGADAWQDPDLYHMDVQAGAPPDDFAVKGQNWGFPTYNWERMMKDGFKWWRLRFEQMSYYFDAFRIDHILGFFRIWSIPVHSVEGIMGRFVPAIPVHVNEFAERDIYFDRNRYCRPFITDEVLNEVFGENAATVKSKFLQYDGFDQYILKDEFDTQQKIEKHFAEADDPLKYGLFDLLSNVILFEEDESAGTKFHFRFSMQETISFRSLDSHTQHQLKELYINYFFQRQDHHWQVEAMQKLPGLKRSTNMLVCGEDLGLVPHCVPDVMKQLGILSLEIQRMPKAVNRRFFHPGEAPYLSVVTPSTHDMSTIRGWWEEDRNSTQVFYNTELNQSNEAPQYCEPWINKAIVLQHLYSPAMWSIFQVQDLLGMNAKLRREDPAEERINLPSDPQHYWNYRMHIPLESLLKETEFNNELKEYIQAAGRN